MYNDAALAAWYRDDGDNTRNILYPLTESSVVFDVGGFEGNWSAKIEQRYNCFIHIFEPVKKAYNITRERFQNNQKIQVHNFGLSIRDEEINISVKGDGSNTWSLEGEIETVLMKDVKKVVSSPIDLISINIEGGEYTLLPEMIASGAIKNCNNIQIQFHDAYPNYEVLRNSIKGEIQKTHAEVYDYPFVWECWTKK